MSNLNIKDWIYICTTQLTRSMYEIKKQKQKQNQNKKEKKIKQKYWAN